MFNNRSQFDGCLWDKAIVVHIDGWIEMSLQFEYSMLSRRGQILKLHSRWKYWYGAFYYRCCDSKFACGAAITQQLVGRTTFTTILRGNVKSANRRHVELDSNSNPRLTTIFRQHDVSIGVSALSMSEKMLGNFQNLDRLSHTTYSYFNHFESVNRSISMSYIYFVNALFITSNFMKKPSSRNGRFTWWYPFRQQKQAYNNSHRFEAHLDYPTPLITVHN